MTQAWKYPGARWWKFDFHTHTPASKDTKAWQTAAGTADELTPERWLRKYMEAGLDCVAITDHNSGDWVDRLKAANHALEAAADAGNAPPWFRELHLFPGVEISVNGGFHLLAIFDPSKDSQFISDLLAVARYDGTRGDSDEVTQESAVHVMSEVIKRNGVVIPAHVDGEKGLLQEASGTSKSRLDPNTIRQALKVPGLLALEWCNMSWPGPAILHETGLRLAKVIGSDCHSFQGAAVPGSRYTWVKMAEPSVEGLRLALLDGQGVSIRRSDDGDGFAPFHLPDQFIESIEIRQARWMGLGKPAGLAFNPYFNALVGGRGSGKSTVVHALRLAYRREKELPPQSEAGQTFQRFNKVARNRHDEGGLRADTMVSAQINRDGVRHRLTWRQDGQGPAVEVWNDAQQEFDGSGSQAINPQRFAIRLFSQGQIAALAGHGSQALLKVIDDAADISTQKAALEEAKRTYLSTRAQLREMDGKLHAGEGVKLSLQDVQRKLARFEGTDHATVLKSFQRASRQTRELGRQFDAATEQASKLAALALTLQTEDLPDALFDSSADDEALRHVRQLHTAMATMRANVEQAAKSLTDQARHLWQELSLSMWMGRVNQTTDAYEKWRTELQQQGVNDPSEYGRLVQEKQRLDNDLKRLESLHTQRATVLQVATEQGKKVKAARQAISARREEFLAATLQDNRFVQMALVPYGETASDMDQSLRDLLGTGEDNFKNDLYAEAQGDTGQARATGLIADIQSIAALTGNFDEQLLHAKKRLLGACRGQGDFGARFNKFLASATEKRPELEDHIKCWFPEDGLRVTYSRKGTGTDFQPIEQASAGQRAAAMLAFLLAHGGEPLVLDQPEDDLDNHLIYDLVVQQIRDNKLRRQLIVVTHNPNIVVNGDAELIHVLDFNHQCYVKESGSLQRQDMRQEVCQVMEGGKEAFERRYQRLGREVQGV